MNASGRTQNSARVSYRLMTSNSEPSRMLPHLLVSLAAKPTVMAKLQGLKNATGFGYIWVQ
jgi:hypothetical protein